MTPARGPAYRWVILAVAFLGIFGAMGLGRFGYSTVLPDMQTALGLSGAAAGSLASWNLAGYTLMALVGGLLASRFGPRKVVTTGMVLTAGGMLLTGFSDSLAAASGGRLLSGVGNGMVMAPSIALLPAWFDGRRLGLASTIAASGNGVGMIVAGPLVPRIIEGGGIEGWRLAWYFFAAVTIFMALLTFVLERDRPDGTAPATPPKPPGAKPPLVDLTTVAGSGHSWHLGWVYFLYGFAYLTYFTFFQKRLVADLDYSSKTAGSLFLVVGASSLVFGVLWGAVSDRIGRGRTLATILALQALAAGLFALRPNMASLIISAILFGSGVFSVPGLIGAACGDRFGPKLAFTSLGFVTVFIGAGMGIGPYVGGLLEDRFSSLAPSYMVSAAVFIVAALAAAFLGDARGRHT